MNQYYDYLDKTKKPQKRNIGQFGRLLISLVFIVRILLFDCMHSLMEYTIGAKYCPLLIDDGGVEILQIFIERSDLPEHIAKLAYVTLKQVNT